MKMFSHCSTIAPRSAPSLRLYLLLALALIICCGDASVTPACPHRRPARTTRHRHQRTARRRGRAPASLKKLIQPSNPERAEAAADGEENVEGRENWFLFQRTYPFDSIPADARRRAWESRPIRGKGPELESLTETINWSPVGPAPTIAHYPNFGVNSGRINAIAISPANPQVILVGASTGGIWRSVDGGGNFMPVSDTQADLAVGSIAFSPSNPAIAYAGMGDASDNYLGSGVLKSTDGGQTWTRVSNTTLPTPGTVFKIDVDPANPNRVYLALYRTSSLTDNTYPPPPGGFFVSDDGGINWTDTFAGLPRDFVINPANPQILYLAMRGGPLSNTALAGGVYRSTDGGNTWTIIYTSPYGSYYTSPVALRDIRVAVSPANPQKIYVYSGHDSEVRLAVSTDGGTTFPTDHVLSSVDGGQLGYNTYIYADPANADTIYVGSRDVYKSTDGGASWVNLTRANAGSNFGGTYSTALTHPDQHSLAFLPGNSAVVYIGNDGGLYQSTDGGGSFQSLNATLSLTQFVSIARHPTNTSITYGGTQDNGTQRRTAANPNQWQDFAGGDGGHCLLNPRDPSMVFTTYYDGDMLRWRSNGDIFDRQVAKNSTFNEPATAPRMAFYPPFVTNGVNSTLYFGTWRLFVSTDLGNSWSAPGGATDLTRGLTSFGKDVLDAIGVAPSDGSVIYTGSDQGRAMVTTDGGRNWTDITAGLPNRTISSITVDPADSSRAYLTVSGFGSGHLFRTTDRGTTWTDLSGNLPNVPANALLLDPNGANTIYLGTDVGVFRSTSGGNSWETLDNGLPPVVVMAFSINSSGQIQVATYGRGAYEGTRGTSVNDFSVSAATTAQSVTLGNVASFPINTATTGGNAQPLSLSVAGLPSNAQASFNPLTVTSGSSSVLTVSTNSLTPIGSFTLTISGAGSVVRTTTVVLNTTAPAPNQIDEAAFFVNQHYQDFLNRAPDQGGLDYWTNQITQCGTDAACLSSRRIGVSAAFFIEMEFQITGSYVYDLYKAGLGRRPSFSEFGADRNMLHVGSTLAPDKQALALSFVQRPEFVQKYQGATTAEAFVSAVLQTAQADAGVDLSSQRSTLLGLWDGKDTGKAAIISALAQQQVFVQAEYNRAFVLMQYFGYLRREPDQAGYDFWLNVLNTKVPNDASGYRAMVCAFITSTEYQRRFGSSVTRTNKDCSS